MITPIYTSVLALLFVILSIRTIRVRRKYKVGVGDGNKEALKRAMRVHANFAEYVPLSIILLYFLESNLLKTEIGYDIWVHMLGGLLVTGRVLHAYGVSQARENLKFRVTGMAMTFTVMIATASSLLVVYL